MFACEYTRGGATGNRLPVLLRLSEDDAETWEKKVALTWKVSETDFPGDEVVFI
jgi:hypothetical protein